MVNELNLDPRTEVKIKNIDVEVVKGELSEKPWLIDENQQKYVLLEEEQYNDLIDFLKHMLEENLELKMEQKIMAELPVDFEDVKVVVKKEIENKNISIDKAIDEVKRNYPNLFHRMEIENLLEEFFI